MTKRVLLTGSSGFVGNHFHQALYNQRWDITPVDLKDGNDARDFFRRVTERFDLVVHCAAVVGGRKMIDGAPLALASNMELDSGLFQWALRNKPGRVLYFSSSAAYPVMWQSGDSGYKLQERLIDEKMTGNTMVGVPDQLYGWTKLTGENLAHRYRQEGGKVSVVRPFSGYGEDQSSDYPFPAFIGRAIVHSDPFKVWGDGTQTRDFIHIDDIIRACLVMIDNGIDGPVNLGTGVATSMTQLAKMAMDEVGIPRQGEFSVPIQYETSAPSGVAYRVADVKRLNEFYTPRVTLEEGIARAVAYWR
jgi:nucleoside-diphosphate-sugar epimerase